ncbi:MAG TPA: pitrilysin family protein [Thermoanaerobaculia bacterium]|nr:pitrilysin family protein [Thermoanaerobaculia bacterium]
MRPTTRTLLAACCLLAAALAPAAAQVEKVDQLRYPPLPEQPIPVPERVVLDNGLVVLLLEDHELPLIEASAVVRTGSRLEPAAKAGLAELTGQVLRTGGTKKRSGDQLDDLLESRAATIETSIGETFGRASLSSLTKDFPEMVQLLAEVLREPAFDPAKLEVAKNRVVAEIARQNDDPLTILFREFEEVVYGPESPYTRQPTYASVAAIGPADLAGWHREHFHPDRIVLGLVGDFRRADALALVRRAFGDWPRGPQAGKVDVPLRERVPPGVFLIERPDLAQSSIAIGYQGIRKDAPDFYAVEVMNQVLSGSFASRLFSTIRTQKGLAYAVSGSVGSQWDHPGETRLFLTTKRETTGAAIDALLEEARNMVAKPPTDEEVAKAKQSILNSFVFTSDSARKVMQQQLTFEYYGYPLDWLSRYRRGVEAVTTAEVRAAAAKHLRPGEFAILVVAPPEGRDRPLTDFGPVTAVDVTIPEPPAPGR